RIQRDDRPVLAPPSPPPRADWPVHREAPAPRPAAVRPDVAVGPSTPAAVTQPPAPARADSPAAGRPAVRVYVVQPGDSLIGIARKAWGRKHQGRYRLIYQANRSKLPDESRLSPGQKLIIPALPVAPAPTRPANPAVRPPARYTEVALEALSERLSAERWYTVRPGDSLTGIARRQMRDGSNGAVRRLYQANRDRIVSPDRLRVGLKLRIPT
ncbi:hypothetical protein LCGC14_2652620, partial [marine sediment metagenome]